MHDDLCPCINKGDKRWCECDLIAKVRADERERAEQSRYVWVPSQREILADLRAKVDALRDRPIASFDGYTGRDALDQVLVLLDGSSDE